MTYWHDTTLSLLDTLENENATMLDGPNSSAVHIDQVAASTYLATLLQFRLTNIAMQRDKLVFRVDQPES